MATPGTATTYHARGAASRPPGSAALLRGSGASPDTCWGRLAPSPAGPKRPGPRAGCRGGVEISRPSCRGQPTLRQHQAPRPCCGPRRYPGLTGLLQTRKACVYQEIGASLSKNMHGVVRMCFSGAHRDLQQSFHFLKGESAISHGNSRGRPRSGARLRAKSAPPPVDIEGPSSAPGPVL